MYQILFQGNWFRFSTELMTQVKTLQIQRKMQKQRSNPGVNGKTSKDKPEDNKSKETSSAINEDKKNE